MEENKEAESEKNGPESIQLQEEEEREVEENENPENEDQSNYGVGGLTDRKDSVESVDSKTGVIDSEEDEEEIEDDGVVEDSPGEEDLRQDSPEGSPLAQEIADKGEDADAESDGASSKLKVEKKLKLEKKHKKKRGKKKMEGIDVFINGESKKRTKPQPNKRKKIRKLLTEDKLNEDTLQALWEEKERQKRLGLFLKEDTNGTEAHDLFKLLENDNGVEFPELSYNLDFIDNLNMEYDSVPSTSTRVRVQEIGEDESAETTSGIPVNNTTAPEANMAASESSLDSMAMIPALQQSESNESFSTEVARFEQLLRQKSENGTPPGGGINKQIVTSGLVQEASTITKTPSHVQHVFSQASPKDNLSPPSGQTTSSNPIVNSSISPGYQVVNSANQLVNSSGMQENIPFQTPFTLASNIMPAPMQGMSSTLVHTPMMGYPQPSYMWNSFKPPAPPEIKPPVRQSSEVICISSESSDEEKGKTQEKGVASKRIETINISSGSESSDEVIFTGTDDNEIVEEDPDVNNSGMHVNDAMNQPDHEGRVLVNKNRPPDEPEIFLSPRLARAVKPHQIGGIRFMFDNIIESLEHYKKSSGFGCILAHSMGLGKTLQMIAFIDVFLRYTGAGTALCVVPVNTLLNWVAEFDFWLPACRDRTEDSESGRTEPRTFKVRLLSDAQKTTQARARVIADWKKEGGVLLMGYEMFRLLTNQKLRWKKKKKKKNIPPGIIETIDLEEEERMRLLTAEIYEHLVKPGPDLIVCDEGHRIKNSHASISQALKQIATRRRIVLTGYPLQNNLLEYWCMVDFVRPSFLGTKQEFSNMFERPICNGQCADSNQSDIRLMRFRSHVLHSLLKGFVQRRSHLVLMNCLPPKEEYVLLVRFSPWQKKLYNNFIKIQKDQGSGSWCSALNPIKAFSICCKVWNHPDVLYRAVIRKTLEEQNNDSLIDMDLDLPEAVLEGLVKKARRKRNEKPVEGTNGKLVQGVGFSPFGDVKDRGTNYDWAKDLLKDYSPNKVEFSGKMLILMKIIDHSVSLGDKILVFSQSLTTLTLIEEFLARIDVPNVPGDPTVQRKWRRNESYFRLDGNTNTAEREKMIQIFNHKDNKTVHVFLLSTRAGCLGINLVGANRVVVFDISWNPCHDAQAVCRVYRYGQAKKCVIYRLICDQSMEKKIYDRQISKQGMSDRVVDELNPIQSLERQDITKLLIYDDEELPAPDLGEFEKECRDETLKDTCRVYGNWLTRKPFYHESLLMDCKGTRLTKAEKRAAQKGYEHEKQASSSCNYSRQSYSNFYAAAGYPSKATPGSKKGIFSNTSTASAGRPVANVKPVQSTPYPMQVGGNMPFGPAGDAHIIQHLQRAGINVRKTIASTDIPLPLSTAGPNSKPLVMAGEAFYMIHGVMGLYIGTTSGRIFALRSQKPDEQKGPSPIVQTPGGQAITTRERESQIIKSAFNTMMRRNPNVHPPIRYPYTAPQPIGTGFSQMPNFGQYQPPNCGSLANTSQNFVTSQQNPLLNQQNLSMTQQMEIMNQQGNLMSQQNFSSTEPNPTMNQQNPAFGQPNNPMTQQNSLLDSEVVSQVPPETSPSLVSALLSRQSSLNPGSSVAQGIQNQKNFSSAPELSSLLGYDMMKQQNFSTPAPYTIPSYNFNQQQNWPSQKGNMTQQTGNMTQQTGSMIQRMHSNMGQDALMTQTETLSKQPDESLSLQNDMVTQQNNMVTQQNDMLTPQLSVPEQALLLSSLASLLPDHETVNLSQPNMVQSTANQLANDDSYSLIQEHVPPSGQQVPPN